MAVSCGHGGSAAPDGGTSADASSFTDGGPLDARASDAPAPADAAHDGSPDAAGLVTASFTPTPIPASAPELPDPLRGQYLWLGTPAYPAGWPDIDSYQRWNWAQLEPSEGNYQWSLIDDQIAAAKARGGRFGMRIMALCQGCGDHTYMNAQTSIPDDLADVANPLIGSAPGDSTKYLIPDWNSDAYFTRLTALLTAIASRYGSDPHFAWMDVSSYGNWGEMHLYPFTSAGGPYDTSTQKPITDANAVRLVQLNTSLFSNKLLVVNAEQQAALATAIASASPPVGIRVDCLGSDDLAGGAAAIAAVDGGAARWQTAPFITEWCQVNLGTSGADLFVQGESQVRQYHVSMLSSGNFTAKPTTTAETTAFTQANVEAGYRLRAASVKLAFDPSKPSALSVDVSWVNDNVAPTYLKWNVVLGLRAGTTVVEAPLAVDLRTVLPGSPVDDAEVLALSAPLAAAAGGYDVYVRVDDAQAVAPPMQLAMSGRDTTGQYVLGTFVVP
ncbi:MAG TPA: DUF4832 domain-containing protein [Polyangiaceae bacterium]